MPPKQVTKRRLERIAVTSARQLSAELGEPVLCKYEGQQYGPKKNPRYRVEPSEWVVEEGGRHSQTHIVYAFKRGGEAGQWEPHAQLCSKVTSRERAVPPESWWQVSLEELTAAAKLAGEKASAELEEPVSCEPLGQCYGPLGQRRYRQLPGTWRVPKGERHSQQNLGWLWKRPTEGIEEVTEQLCNNALARGVERPETWSRARVDLNNVCMFMHGCL